MCFLLLLPGSVLSTVNFNISNDTTVLLKILEMVKHVQTIRGKFADELFECVWPFCGVGA